MPQETVRLPYDSEEYQAHEGTIQVLKKRAKAIGVLGAEFERQIFSSLGFVCSRPRESRESSAARGYFHLANGLVVKNGQIEKDEETERTTKERELALGVIGTRFSVGHQQMDPDSFPENETLMSIYYEAVEDLEQFCSDNKIPSLLPYLYEGISLENRLKDIADNPTQDGFKELYERVAFLCAHQTDHFYRVLKRLNALKQHDLVLSIVSDVLSGRSIELHQLLNENPNNFNQYVIACRLSGNHGDVRALCRSIPFEDLLQRDVLLGSYLQSLFESGQMEDLFDVLESIPKDTLSGNIFKTYRIMCMEIGKLCVREKQFEDGAAFLERRITFEKLANEDAGLLRAYVECLQQLSGREEDEKRWAKRLSQM